jgi:hypothetical protein
VEFPRMSHPMPSYFTNYRVFHGMNHICMLHNIQA